MSENGQFFLFRWYKYSLISVVVHRVETSFMRVWRKSLIHKLLWKDWVGTWWDNSYSDSFMQLLADWLNRVFDAISDAGNRAAPHSFFSAFFGGIIRAVEKNPVVIILGISGAILFGRMNVLIWRTGNLVYAVLASSLALGFVFLRRFGAEAERINEMVLNSWTVRFVKWLFESPDEGAADEIDS